VAIIFGLTTFRKGGRGRGRGEKGDGGKEGKEKKNSVKMVYYGLCNFL